MDRGAWWATVHRVTKSRTQLKQLSTRWCIYLHLFAFNLYVSLYLKWTSWASLVAQWWWRAAHLPAQETKVLFPVWEDSACPRAAGLAHHNYWACDLEPQNRNYWAHSCWSLHTLELLAPSGTGHHSEKPAHDSYRAAPLSVTGEGCGQWQGPGIAKRK